MRTVTDADLIDVVRAQRLVRGADVEDPVAVCDDLGAIPDGLVEVSDLASDLHPAVLADPDGGVTCVLQHIDDGSVAKFAAVSVYTGAPLAGDSGSALASPDELVETPDGHTVVASIEESDITSLGMSLFLDLLSSDGTTTLLVEVPTWVDGNETIALELMDNLIAAVQPAG